METYNYDDSVVSAAETEMSAAPAAPNGNAPAAPGFGPEGSSTPSLPGEPPAAPGFGPIGPVTPSLPGSSTTFPEFNTGRPAPSLPSRPQGCINCTGPMVQPTPNAGILWTWGTLSPFFSTSPSVAHVRFYNAAMMREPVDIYLNGRLVVSNLDFMNYTNYLHIVAGFYRLTIFRRTNPIHPIIDTGVQFNGGLSYTLILLGVINNFSVQLVTS